MVRLYIHYLDYIGGVLCWLWQMVVTAGQ